MCLSLKIVMTCRCRRHPADDPHQQVRPFRTSVPVMRLSPRRGCMESDRACFCPHSPGLASFCLGIWRNEGPSAFYKGTTRD